MEPARNSNEACVRGRFSAPGRNSTEGSGRREGLGLTVDIRIGVEIVDLLDDVCLGNIFGEVDVEGLDSHLGARFPLRRHIALRVLPAPDDHHRQPRGLPPPPPSSEAGSAADNQRAQSKSSSGNLRIADQKPNGSGSRFYLAVGLGEGSDFGGDLIPDGLGDGLPVDDLRRRRLLLLRRHAEDGGSG